MRDVHFYHNGTEIGPDSPLDDTVYDAEHRTLRIEVQNRSLYALSGFDVKMQGLDDTVYDARAPEYVRPAGTGTIHITVYGERLDAVHGARDVPSVRLQIRYRAGRVYGGSAQPAGEGTGELVGTARQRGVPAV